MATLGLQDPQDPRLLDDFNVSYYPLCDGTPAPLPGSLNLVDRRMIEFAAAYYTLNVCYCRLQQAQKKGDPLAINAALLEIGRAVDVRDALEDRLAPEGFYAEPEIEGLVTVNLVFHHALKHSDEYQNNVAPFRFTIPLPESGANIDEHLQRYLSAMLGPHTVRNSANREAKPQEMS